MSFDGSYDVAAEIFAERRKHLPWRVCLTCLGICNGYHEAMLATHELTEQRCPWRNDLGYQCALAAPHGGSAWHVNVEAPEGHRRWSFGVDEMGNRERPRYSRERGRRARPRRN